MMLSGPGTPTYLYVELANSSLYFFRRTTPRPVWFQELVGFVLWTVCHPFCSRSGETAWRKKVWIMVSYGGIPFYSDDDGAWSNIPFSLYPVIIIPRH